MSEVSKLKRFYFLMDDLASRDKKFHSMKLQFENPERFSHRTPYEHLRFELWSVKSSNVPFDDKDRHELRTFVDDNKDLFNTPHKELKAISERKTSSDSVTWKTGSSADKSADSSKVCFFPTDPVRLISSRKVSDITSVDSSAASFSGPSTASAAAASEALLPDLSRATPVLSLGRPPAAFSAALSGSPRLRPAFFADPPAFLAAPPAAPPAFSTGPPAVSDIVASVDEPPSKRAKNKSFDQAKKAVQTLFDKREGLKQIEPFDDTSPNYDFISKNGLEEKLAFMQYRIGDSYETVQEFFPYAMTYFAMRKDIDKNKDIDWAFASPGNFQLLMNAFA